MPSRRPQYLDRPGHPLDRVRQAVEHRRDLAEQSLAIGVEHHRLVAAFEQRRSMKRSSDWTRRLSAGADKASSVAAALTEPSRAT